MTLKYRKILFLVLIFLLALGYLVQAQGVYAQILLSAPEKVARGDAFLARAFTEEPVDKIVFFWKGRSYPVQTTATTDKSGKSVSMGEILLPVGLDETAKMLKLGAGAAGGSQKQAIASVHVPVQFFDRNRPVQKLKVDKKYVDPPASAKEKIRQDREKVQEALQDKLPDKMWSLPFLRPVPGDTSSLFGMKRVFNGQPRSVHRGLDLRGAQGTPIKACADGRVALVDDLYFSGKTVYVNHGDGVFSAYLHMSEPKVQAGQMVKKGDVIGLVGATGRVTGPHLHLSTIVQGQSVDPASLLESR